MEKVILVNRKDQKVGLMEKLEAHKKGLLHRAFSLFIFNDKGELLLQQRALEKYHCGGIRTNTVCSHQRDGESTIDASKRRIVEEMGLRCGTLEVIGSFIYKAEFKNGLTEHEYDYVVIGKYNGKKINPNPFEVMDYKWVHLTELKKDIEKSSGRYSKWLKIVLKKGILETYIK